MSVTRVHRLLQLINLMRSGQAFDPDELAARLKVSRRTVYRDLDLLARSGVPCRHDMQRGGYVIDEWYFLPPVSLTLQEAVALYVAATQMANPQNFPLYKQGLRALKRISQALPVGLRDLSARMAQVVEVRWPSLADAAAIGQSFQKLQAAAAESRKVRLRYDSYYERREIATVVHPYLLALVSRGWYLFAYSEIHRQVRTFKMDRILSAEPLNAAFTRPTDFSLDKHLGQAWCLIPEGKIWHVKLLFLPTVAGNVEETIWHPTQRTQRQQDGSLLFEADVDGLTEISWWVMGYGDQVIVQEPRELRDRICQMAEGVLRNYRAP